MNLIYFLFQVWVIYMVIKFLPYLLLLLGRIFLGKKEKSHSSSTYAQGKKENFKFENVQDADYEEIP